jgi:hypothetical protein
MSALVLCFAGFDSVNFGNTGMALSSMGWNLRCAALAWKDPDNMRVDVDIWLIYMLPIRY